MQKGEFEQLRTTKLSKACLVIQKTWRMYNVRRKYLKFQKGAIDIQAGTIVDSRLHRSIIFLYSN